MLRKLPTIAAMLVLLTLLAAPLVLAQTDAPVTRPPADGYDPYRVFISNDLAVRCDPEVGTVGDPMTEFCMEYGIVPRVLYDANGNLIAGSGANTGIQYDNSSDRETPDLAQLGDCWYDPDDAYVVGPDSNIPIIDTPCGIIN
jgi:hypothetical protein